MELNKKSHNKFKKLALKMYRPIDTFLNIFYDQGTFHGINFLGNHFLHFIEKFFWIVLILASFYFVIILSLESWDRYQTKSTVVTIENDHYYWNSSLPSLTICPMTRLSRDKFDQYCLENDIYGQEREEFFEFLTSLANASYINFENIKDYRSIKNIHLHPEDYMDLIYNLTEDMTQRDTELKVRTIINLEFILTVQTLTEFGICYTANNYIAPHLTPQYLLFGKPFDENEDPFYRNEKVHRVRAGNLFDEQVTYSFIGFQNETASFIHSPHDVFNPAKAFVYATDAYEFQANMVEILASNEFREQTTIKQRGCRFETESNLTHFRTYTKGLCLQECRINLAMKYCGCIPHFYPNRIRNPKKVCSYQVLKRCFPRNKEIFLQFRDKDKSINCFCEPNCSDSIIIIEQIHVLPGTKTLLGSTGSLVAVQKYPTIRFVRRVLFTFTDLLVSVGGTAGLLLGFSVLGVVEIIYFFTLRLFWYLYGRR